MTRFKSLKLWHAVTSLTLILILLFTACSPAVQVETPLKEITTAPLTVTILHVGDTHSYDIPHDIMLKINGTNTLATVGGWTTLMAAVQDIRYREKNVLLLHSGDIIEGTIWTNKFGGLADCDAMNALQFDAMELGNHEFSKGPDEAANLVNRIQFPVLAANLDVSREPALAGKIKPYTTVQFEGQKIGIIGLITPDTAFINYPGKNIVFLPVEATARKYISELNGQGINKIIVLSHLGYPADVSLAKAVPGIDIIVGGHSHTFMGGPEFQQIGLQPEMPYPTEMTGPSGDKVLIVHAWEYNQLLGQIKLNFDDKGKIESYTASPFIYSTNGFKLEDSTGWNHLCSCMTQYGEIMSVIAKNPEFKIYWNSPEMDKVLQPYVNEAAAEINAVVGTSSDDLIRGPNTGPGPVVADAFLWSAQKIDPSIQMALYDTYDVRADIFKGPVLENDAYMVLPLRQNLVTMTVSGSILKKLLEMGIDSHVKIDMPPPCFEIAGFKMTVDMTRKSGERITSIEVKNADGSFTDLDSNAQYKVVTTDYLADKGITPLINKLSWLGPLADNLKSWIMSYVGYKPLGIRDVDSLIDYIQTQKTIGNNVEERTTVIEPPGK
ncbi:MAG: 5'-nucleotidase C-terminal domain-containing protein [Dehalococcoidia bacterium]|jgi:5'-nucleotidase